MFKMQYETQKLGQMLLFSTPHAWVRALNTAEDKEENQATGSTHTNAQ